MLDDVAAGRECLDLEVTSGNGAERDELVRGLELLLSDNNYTNRSFGNSTTTQSSVRWDESLIEGVQTPQPFKSSSSSPRISSTGFLSTFMRRRSSGATTVSKPNAARLSYFSTQFSGSMTDIPTSPPNRSSSLYSTAQPVPEDRELQPQQQSEDVEELEKRISPRTREKLALAANRARQHLPPPSVPSQPTKASGSVAGEANISGA